MASGKEYLDFLLEQLSGLDDVSYRAMMGESIPPYFSPGPSPRYRSLMDILAVYRPLRFGF